MRKINACLNQNLVKICALSHQLDKLQGMVQALLPEHLRAYVRVGQFQQGQLLLMCEEANWMTELHYFLPQLRDRLREEYSLYQLSGIRVKSVTPHQCGRSKLATAPSLSSAARQTIMASATAIEYAPIQVALQNLAREKKDK